MTKFLNTSHSYIQVVKRDLMESGEGPGGLRGASGQSMTVRVVNLISSYFGMFNP